MLSPTNETHLVRAYLKAMHLCINRLELHRSTSTSQYGKKGLLGLKLNMQFCVKSYLILWYIFLFITPFPCQFNSCFHSFSSSVHWQHHFIPKHACQIFRKDWEFVIVESSGTECKPFGLFYQSS